MAAADAEGLDVVRLCSGDPAVFSAVAEQARRLDQAGHRLRHHPGGARVRRRRGGPAPGADRAGGRPDRRAHPDRAPGHRRCRRARTWPASARPARPWCCTWPCSGSSRWSPSSPRTTAPDCPAAVVAYASQEREVIAARHPRRHRRAGARRRREAHRGDHRRPGAGRRGIPRQPPVLRRPRPLRPLTFRPRRKAQVQNGGRFPRHPALLRPRRDRGCRATRRLPPGPDVPGPGGPGRCP